MKERITNLVIGLRCCDTAQFSRLLVSQRRCNILGRGKLGARIKMAISENAHALTANVTRKLQQKLL